MVKATNFQDQGQKMWPRGQRQELTTLC